ncbi:MAG: PilZ domain-containing protein [Armatimonadetes bacterium]|nr:PilZ domain-containing protein [Armatimonadota bacterium]
MDNKRETVRHRVLKAGTIAFRGAGISCRVRNLSASGAALEVENQIGIPPSFDLVLEPDHVNRPCHVVWRKERRIGVAFD